MTKTEFFTMCKERYLTDPDYPFDDPKDAAVFRHPDNKKWYALCMNVSRAKFGFDTDEHTDIVNLKLPVEMFGSFTPAEGVYPAYHMNKAHWISVILADADHDTVSFLTDASYFATENKIKPNKRKL